MLFKKPITTGRTNLVGNKDRKRLREFLISEYNGFTESEAADILNEDEELTIMKIQGTRISIYFLGSIPIFFDPTGFNDIFPTIYVLCRFPSILPIFVIPDPVSKFILGGADLMIPGIIKPNSTECYSQDGLRVNMRMAVRVNGNAIPIAVGRCLVSDGEFARGKGKALEILHTYGDALWNLGPKEKCPNAGFGGAFVMATDPPFEENALYYNLESLKAMALETSDDDDGWEVTSEKNKSFAENTAVLDWDLDPALEETRAVDVQTETGISETPPLNNVVCETQDFVPGNESSAPIKAAAESDVAPPVKLPPSVIDLLLELALLEVLHSDFSEASCPMPISGLFSKMSHSVKIAQQHPQFRQRLFEVDTANAITSSESITLSCDIKQSSFKKLAKFFQHYSKKKLLQTKEVRGDILIVSINKQSPIYTEYTRPNKKTRSDVKPATTHATEQPAALNSFHVLEFYLPTLASQKIFVDISPSIAGQYFTEEQCRQALSAYIDKCQLKVHNDQRRCQLDDVLQACVLYKSERKDAKEKKEMVVMDLAELYKKFLSNLSKFHAVSRSPIVPSAADLNIRPGKLSPIKIQVEKRSGRKAVTTIANIQSFEINEKPLAETLQKVLASSATTYELTGAAKGKKKPLAIMVQGSFVNEIADVLTTQYGIPKRFIAQ